MHLNDASSFIGFEIVKEKSTVLEICHPPFPLPFLPFLIVDDKRKWVFEKKKKAMRTLFRSLSSAETWRGLDKKNMKEMEKF